MSGNIIHLVGCGPGSRDYLVPMAGEVVSKAGVVIGPQKLVRLFDSIPGRIILTGPSIDNILEEISRHFQDSSVAVLVSGDPGCFSLSRLVIDRFGLRNCRVIPGISSVQLALSRLGLDWTGAEILSVHGRPADHVQAGILKSGITVILLGPDLAWMAPVFNDISFAGTFYLMQDLGLHTETISTIDSVHDLGQKISPRSILVVVPQNTEHLDLQGLPVKQAAPDRTGI